MLCNLVQGGRGLRRRALEHKGGQQRRENEAPSTSALKDGRLRRLQVYPSVGTIAEVKMETQFGLGTGFYSER